MVFWGEGGGLQVYFHPFWNRCCPNMNMLKYDIILIIYGYFFYIKFPQLQIFSLNIKLVWNFPYVKWHYNELFRQ